MMKPFNLPTGLFAALAAMAVPLVSIDAFFVPTPTSLCSRQTAIPPRVQRPSSLPPSNDHGAMNDYIPSSSVAVMMSQENKRILIEELGYRRKEAERLRLDLVPDIVQQRIRCPTEGIPEEWCSTGTQHLHAGYNQAPSYYGQPAKYAPWSPQPPGPPPNLGYGPPTNHRGYGPPPDHRGYGYQGPPPNQQGGYGPPPEQNRG
ncbi:expressed unknown protein [Seminavis robusta]|uniref:Uncharacterized protein n=1 Tax=Seminavis robusta TaxID=568900 RepID=A0A9N8I0J0_9STRA|nr:expressed unknown protein [Seminavis robusta]|eukprot:Sro2725_g335610.1 n/a (203) ;mRNA; f:4061-4669